MDERQETHLTARELNAFFDRLFPHGFRRRRARGDRAGGVGSIHRFWRACTHRLEQLFEERVSIHRNLEQWRQLARQRGGKVAVDPRPEPDA